MLKKIIFRILSVTLVCTMSYQWVFAEGNLLENPSFEEVVGSIPRYWETWVWNEESGIAEFTVEQENPHSGQNCVAIENKEERDSRYVQKVKVEPDSQYKFSAWIRAENVGQKSKGANISLMGKTITSRDIKGTVGQWEYVELYIKTMKDDVGDIELSLGLGGYGRLNKGKAFFDDVALEKVDSIPDDAIVVTVGNDTSGSSDGNQQSGSDEKSGMGTWAWLLIYTGILAIIFIYYVKKGRIKFVGKESEPDDEETQEEE